MKPTPGLGQADKKTSITRVETITRPVLAVVLNELVQDPKSTMAHI